MGALQYDTTMVPLVHVRTSKNPLSYEECSGETGELEFEVDRIQPGKTTKSSASRDGSRDQKLGQSEESQLRRRKQKPESPDEREGDGVEEVAVVKEGETLEEEEREAKDPLKWFGILVPQALRHSQSCFVQGKQQCVIVI